MRLLRFFFLFVSLSLSGDALWAQQTPPNQRVSRQDNTWADWLKRSGELPPDFSRMPTTPFLSNPLIINKKGEDIPVRTPAQWAEKRAWIKKEFQHWVSGTVPPAPKAVATRILSDTVVEGVRMQLVEVVFGPDNRAKITAEILTPEGIGPFPVYMTQWTHRSWAQLALQRGYMACIYKGSDGNDDTESYQALYPDYDFSALMRRAWGASRVVDYLMTRPDVNKKQIALTGHSRNGKQSLWAAAFDERFAAVVTSSCGTGGITPWRFSDPQFANQTIDNIMAGFPHWFHPRLRFFFGHEDRLPIDQNMLLALIAPRSLLMHYSIVEKQLSPWASEQTYQSVKQVYQFLRAENRLGILPRMGEHPVMTRDLQDAIDFLDIQFGRSKRPWKNTLHYDYSFANWATTHQKDSTVARQQTRIILPEKIADTLAHIIAKKQILNRLQWLLGTSPPAVKPTEINPADVSRTDWINGITGRPTIKGANVVYIGGYNTMGTHLSGTLYVPVDTSGKRRAGPTGKISTLIYLHEYAYAHGFALNYGNRVDDRGNTRLFQAMLDKGFAVLAIDLPGFGTRIQEGERFYERFPNWSKMGQMVADVRGCVDAVETVDYLDTKRIFLLGNALGGMVALLSAAQDERVAGVAVLGGLSPWRASNTHYESLRTLSHLHGLLPRLGWFANAPQNAPVDVGELLACVAPRPVLLIAPQQDRHTDLPALTAALKPASAVYAGYQKPGNLSLQTPSGLNRLTEPMHGQIADFFIRVSTNVP